MTKQETKQELVSTKLTTLLDSYIDFRVKKSEEEYNANLRHDRDRIAAINCSDKKYVVISSSSLSSELERVLIISNQQQHLQQI